MNAFGGGPAPEFTRSGQVEQKDLAAVRTLAFRGTTLSNCQLPAIATEGQAQTVGRRFAENRQAIRNSPEAQPVSGVNRRQQLAIRAESESLELFRDHRA